VKDEDLEECVHEENSIWLDAGCVQEDRLWGAIETVAVENWLNHDQGLGQILPVQHVPVKRGEFSSMARVNFTWILAIVDLGSDVMSEKNSYL